MVIKKEIDMNKPLTDEQNKMLEALKKVASCNSLFQAIVERECKCRELYFFRIKLECVKLHQ